MPFIVKTHLNASKITGMFIFCLFSFLCGSLLSFPKIKGFVIEGNLNIQPIFIFYIHMHENIDARIVQKGKS